MPEAVTEPAIAERPQIARMRQILEILQQPRTTTEVITRLEMNRKLFYRDINELRALGFVITCDRRSHHPHACYVLKGWQL